MFSPAVKRQYHIPSTNPSEEIEQQQLQETVRDRTLIKTKDSIRCLIG